MQERLQKIIARAGIASRRHAEDLIRSGQVRVNGVVVTELGAKADPEKDRVEAAGRVAQLSQAHVYLLMHKPPDVVSTLADPEGRRTLRNFLVGVSERVFPVGRLDYAASGAIFLTNDGDFASKMLKASPALPQSFWLKVKGRVSDDQLKILSHTVDGKIFPLRGTHAAGKNPPNPWYEAQIAGGRRETLRRNLLAIGHPVEKVKRMKLASLDVDTVQEGHYRQLDAEEVAKLARAVDRALTENKPIPKPRREWRPRAEMLRPKPDAQDKPGNRRARSSESGPRSSEQKHGASDKRQGSRDRKRGAPEKRSGFGGKRPGMGGKHTSNRNDHPRGDRNRPPPRHRG
ncbi:MAG TPA: S4 domain-containing protein [Candidatus Acidoferrales bacterium]|nr:S4 domain-containing protein [Candidatus Acidoferrales bacterium]